MIVITITEEVVIVVVVVGGITVEDQERVIISFLIGFMGKGIVIGMVDV